MMKLFHVSITHYLTQPSIIYETEPSINQSISMVPLQVTFYSEALPTQRGRCVGVSRQSAVSVQCEKRTCSRSLRNGSEAGFVLGTYRSRINDSTSEPPRPNNVHLSVISGLAWIRTPLAVQSLEIYIAPLHDPYSEAK